MLNVVERVWSCVVVPWWCVCGDVVIDAYLYLWLLLAMFDECVM
jgi:hypothetical protein